MGWTSNHSGSNLEGGTTRGGRSSVIVLMYMGEFHEETGTLITIPLSLRIVIAIMVLGTLYLGLLPGIFLHLASEAVSF